FSRDWSSDVCSSDLAVARGAQRVELPALAADENVRSRHARPAGEVEADERDLPRAVRDAAFRRQRSKVVGEVGECPSRAREEAEHAAREHGRGAGDEALRDQLAACHGAMVPLRRVGMPRLALDLDDHAFLPPSWDGHHWTNIAALPSTAEQTAFASVCVRSSGL